MKKLRDLQKDQMMAFKKLNHIQRYLEQKTRMRGNNLLIFGAGLHTERLLDCFDFSFADIRIIDNKKKGNTLRGMRIEKPSEKLYAWADVILISSFFSRDSLRAEIDVKYTEKIIDIYEEDDDERPFWSYEANMDIEEVSEQSGFISKYNAFQPKGSGKRYEETVDRFFFDTVTKHLFLEYINKGDNVLEIGAGTGRLSMELHQAGVKLTAVDTSADMLSVLKEKEPEIRSIVVSGVELPFDDETFDKVVAADVMVHFLNWKEFLREHCRVLKKGGYIICNMVNGDHLKRISDDMMKASAYIRGGYGRFATVTKQELELFCQELPLTLEKMIPYNFFGFTAFGYQCLTPGEIVELERQYHDLCKNEYAREVIRRFESEIVEKCPEWYSASNMCVFRKE